MSRPASVVLVARTHWLVGGAALLAVGFVQIFAWKLPIQFGTASYWITGTFAALYLLTGTCVWFGVPPGRLLSRICGLLYLARPSFGSPLWDAMSQPEYRAFFERS